MAGTRTGRAGTRSLTPETPASPVSGDASPWRRLKIGAVIFAVVLLIGVLLTRCEGGGQPDTTAATGPAAKPTTQAGGSGTGSRARTVKDGVPVGYPRSRQGAVAAAVNYQVARSSPGYFTDAALRRQVLQTVMATSSLPSQLEQDNQGTAALLRALGVTTQTAPDMVMRSAPLGTRVDAYTTETATVDVWMSEVVGVPRDNSPMPVSATWSTYTLILQWQSGDWKAAAIKRSDGPTPLVATDSVPSSTGVMQSANSEFEAPPYAG